MKTLTLREIDVLIQKRFFGSEVTTYNKHFHGTGVKKIPDTPISLTKGGFIFVPKYSEYIEDAWKIVDELSKNYGVEVYQDSVFKRECKIHRLSDDVIETEADTMPLAICKAALKTQGIEVQVDANEISNDI